MKILVSDTRDKANSILDIGYIVIKLESTLLNNNKEYSISS